MTVRSDIQNQNGPVALPWLDPPRSLALKNGEVHVWRASIEMLSSRIEGLKPILSAEELSRAGGFRFQKDRDRFVAGRGLLRLILARYKQIEPAALRFRYGPFGKPMLAEADNGKDLHFNVSHSHALALFAVAIGQEVGVDIERIVLDPQLENTIKQFLSPREIMALDTLAGHSRQRAIFAWWARKEACLKAGGMGLSGDLKQGAIVSGHASTTGQMQGYDGSRAEARWLLQDLDVDPGYAAALAVEGHSCQLECWQWGW